jgi:hypothetical protein
MDFRRRMVKKSKTMICTCCKNDLPEESFGFCSTSWLKANGELKRNKYQRTVCRECTNLQRRTWKITKAMLDRKNQQRGL